MNGKGKGNITVPEEYWAPIVLIRTIFLMVEDLRMAVFKFSVCRLACSKTSASVYVLGVVWKSRSLGGSSREGSSMSPWRAVNWGWDSKSSGTLDKSRYMPCILTEGSERESRARMVAREVLQEAGMMVMVGILIT